MWRLREAGVQWLRVGAKGLLALVLGLALSFMLAPRQGQAQAQTAPVCPPPAHKLTLDQLLFLVQKNKQNEQIPINRLVACHVSFSLDPATIDRLATASVSGRVMDALNQETASTITVEQAHADVATLEGSTGKTTETATAYRNRIEFLKQQSYPDPRAPVYVRYDPDTRKMSVKLGDDGYWFEQVSSMSAETLFKNWREVKARQPYTDDSLHTRQLQLESALISISGYSGKAKAEERVKRAAAEVEARDYDGAKMDYNLALGVDPGNSAARDGLANIERIRIEDLGRIATAQAHMVDLEHQAEALYEEKKYQEVLPLATEVCNSGNQDGCAMEGTLYGRGLGVKKDMDRAKALVIKACDAGNAEGCEALGIAYINALGGLDRDVGRAIDLFASSCDGGFAQGCFDLAFCYQRGLGITKNISRAKEILQRGCDMKTFRSQEACDELKKLH